MCFPRRTRRTAQCVNCGHRVNERATRPATCPVCGATWTDNPAADRDGHVHFRATACDCRPCEPHHVTPVDVRWILRGGDGRPASPPSA